MVRQSRPVLKINPGTNEVVQRFPCVVSACLSMGLSYVYSNIGITDVCKGRRQTYHGFKWRYESENYIYSRPVIATNVRTGVETHFSSLYKAGMSFSVQDSLCYRKYPSRVGSVIHIVVTSLDMRM